jgi:hypothetical protein
MCSINFVGITFLNSFLHASCDLGFSIALQLIFFCVECQLYRWPSVNINNTFISTETKETGIMIIKYYILKGLDGE